MSELKSSPHAIGGRDRNTISIITQDSHTSTLNRFIPIHNNIRAWFNGPIYTIRNIQILDDMIGSVLGSPGCVGGDGAADNGGLGVAGGTDGIGMATG
jgi:hypothetical protein